MSKARIAGGLGAAVIALAIPFVSPLEGRRLDPYYDVGHVLTVCDGETKDVQNRRYTPAECDTLLKASLEAHADDVAACIPADLPDHVKVASLSFAYNVGGPTFCNSTMASKLRAHDIAGGCAELSRWTLIAGKDCRDPANKCGGIVTRRATERRMCEGRA